MADKTEFISCVDEKNAVILEKRLRMCLDFISPFSWLIEAYISDYFVDDLWEKFLPCWRRKLEMMSPPQHSVLLDSSAFDQNKDLQTVLPLSMLAYIKCIDSLSLNRQCVDLDQPETLSEITSLLGQTNSAQSLEIKDRFGAKLRHDTKKCDKLAANVDKRKLSPSSIIDGQDLSLRNVFRKHVKPKKQHEIGRLAKGVSILSDVSKCKNIVDVGAGLGHLSRILAFNQGLSVTTVEAAGTHSPKAFKYDREMEKDISKVLKSSAKGAFESDSVEVKNYDQVLPSHVVCRITPDITPQNFLQLVQQKYTEPHSHQISVENQLSFNEHTSGECASKEGKTDHSCDDQSILSTGNCKTTKRVSDKGQKCEGLVNSENIPSDSPNEHSSDKFKLKDSDLEGDKNLFCGSQSKLSAGDCKTTKCVPVTDTGKECKMQRASDDTRASPNPLSATDGKTTKYVSDELKDFDRTKTSDKISCDGLKRTSVGDCRTANCVSDEKKKCSKLMEDKKLILCGLHACGDLTSTLLRMYLSCDNIVGVASVGCCYMKLTCRCDTNYPQQTLDNEGYPMSNFVKTLPNHELSYTGRNQACHFVDIYKDRLQDDSDHLRVHCYRAAFQLIVLKLLPEYDRGKIKLTVKHTTDLPFEKYCEINLKKLGYNNNVPQDLMLKAKSYLKEWKNVMSFYTVRIALSPVIETIILLDRMLFLHQHGFSSVLVPIFDPKISPRNFLLLSHKHK